MLSHRTFLCFLSLFYANGTAHADAPSASTTFTYEDGSTFIQKNYSYDETGSCTQTIDSNPLPVQDGALTTNHLSISCRTFDDRSVQLSLKYENESQANFEWTETFFLFSIHDLEQIESRISNLYFSFRQHPLYRISGLECYPAKVGVYGKGEIHDKVRITFANGILNLPEDQQTNLDILSKLHGYTNIHYIFRPYEGWSRDMIRCLAAKFRFISSQAQLIGDVWKKLIHEMGGIHGGGKIIHYAHSIGGTETNNAKKLSTPEQLKMITVYTVGSPTMVRNKDFKKVVNYVSKRDGVCYLDPIDYFRGLWNPASCNIVYLDTWSGIPLVDHLLWNPSYYDAIEKLGQEFVKTYSK